MGRSIASIAAGDDKGMMVIVMPNSLGSHPSDDDLEQYSLGRLGEEQAAPLEEHLLVCETCRGRVEEFDEFVAAMRAALRETAHEGPAPARSTALLKWLAAVPKPAWAGAMAAVLAAVLLAPWRQPTPAEPYAVQLEALRAAMSAVAPAGRPLVLTVDFTGLELGRDYRIELVDAFGGGVWSGSVRPSGERAAVALGRSLPRGQYWVRISEPSGELLREFGLSIE
jgi:hypothetical protein